MTADSEGCAEASLVTVKTSGRKATVAEPTAAVAPASAAISNRVSPSSMDARPFATAVTLAGSTLASDRKSATKDVQGAKK